jgi:hypothetical protein
VARAGMLSVVKKNIELIIFVHFFCILQYPFSSLELLTGALFMVLST